MRPVLSCGLADVRNKVTSFLCDCALLGREHAISHHDADTRTRSSWLVL
jgi:hypothetical protein